MENVYSADIFVEKISADKIIIAAPESVLVSDELKAPRFLCRDVSEELAAIASARNGLESIDMQTTDEQAKIAISDAMTMLDRYADALCSIVGSMG